MKKEYIQPSTVAIEINGMTLLTGSPKGDLDPTQTVNPGEVEAPSYDWDDFDEE